MDISNEVLKKEINKIQTRSQRKTRERVKILVVCGEIKEILKSYDYEACELCTKAFGLQRIEAVLPFWSSIDKINEFSKYNTLWAYTWFVVIITATYLPIHLCVPFVFLIMRSLANCRNE